MAGPEITVIQVDAGYCCAGMEYRGAKQIACAPILRKAFGGKTLGSALTILKRSGWVYTIWIAEDGP